MLLNCYLGDDIRRFAHSSASPTSHRHKRYYSPNAFSLAQPESPPIGLDEVDIGGQQLLIDLVHDGRERRRPLQVPFIRRLRASSGQSRRRDRPRPRRLDRRRVGIARAQKSRRNGGANIRNGLEYPRFAKYAVGIAGAIGDAN